ncbi:hypothetical protein ACJMK2_030754, partial [Sinanodonta woodiana]
SAIQYGCAHSLNLTTSTGASLTCLYYFTLTLKMSMIKYALPLRKLIIPRLHKLKNAAYTYNWTAEEDKLLPEHFKKRAWEFMTRDPAPVNYIPEKGRWKMDPRFKYRIPVQNVPIRVLFPRESNNGLWGGEGIIKGFEKKEKDSVRVPHLWLPRLRRSILYSEILDRYMSIMVTRRALDLIDEAYGLDHYILKTHERDLNSRLAMKLKQEMLLALARKSLYPSDPVKRDKIYNRYKEYIIPEEEAEWIGLTVPEALKKAEEMQAKNSTIRPLKEVFTEEIVQKLQG